MDNRPYYNRIMPLGGNVTSVWNRRPHSVKNGSLSSRVAGKLEIFEARIYIAGPLGERRTLQIRLEIAQKLVLLSFCDVASRGRAGLFEVLGRFGSGCGSSSRFHRQPRGVRPYRLIQLRQMMIQAAERVLLSTLTPDAGTGRKIASSITHGGFFAYQALGLLRTLEIVVGVLRRVRPYEFIKPARFEIRMKPRVI